MDGVAASQSTLPWILVMCTFFRREYRVGLLLVTVKYRHWSWLTSLPFHRFYYRTRRHAGIPKNIFRKQIKALYRFIYKSPSLGTPILIILMNLQEQSWYASPDKKWHYWTIFLIYDGAQPVPSLRLAIFWLLLPPMTAPCDIYSRLLFKEGQGYHLWNPALSAYCPKEYKLAGTQLRK